jgi:hydrogenase maturation protein HypF
VAFDGTGYGSDGNIWGGEFLIASLLSFTRAGHLAYVPMPGGAAAIRQPWRMAAAYLDGRGLAAAGDLDVARRHDQHWAAVLAMARQRVNAPLTSSAGRLFDAVAAILGVRDEINYEGQAAIELEQLADPTENSGYRATISSGLPFVVHADELIESVTDDLRAGAASPSVIAGRFHNAVAGLIEDGCVLTRQRTGLATVALSGGVFQNRLLHQLVVARLQARGFAVLQHSRVPCNDGGLSLGQAVVAGATDRAQPDHEL